MVIDTGIFIAYLRAGNKQNTVLFSLSDDRELFISSVTLYEMIEFRDIFIAATCIIHDLSVKTLNSKHYGRIAGLNIEK